LQGMPREIIGKYGRVIATDVERDNNNRRQARAGQLPPTASRATGQKRAQCEQDSAPEGSQAPSGSGRHSETMVRQARAFENVRRKNVIKLIQTVPAAVAKDRAYRDSFIQQLQAAVDSAVETLRCCSDLAQDMHIIEASTREIAVHGYGAVGLVRVPSKRCSHCHKCCTVHPYSVHCVATTPTDACMTWVDMQMLRQFRYLQQVHGLSANGTPHLSCPCLKS
jgi:hypothetical protein